jgi:hypothetical protein
VSDPSTERTQADATPPGGANGGGTPPGEGGPPPSGDREAAPRHSRRGWIVATAVCAVAAIGLGAWAFSLNSDVDDKDAQIAAQQDQLNDQQGLADRAREAAGNLGGGLQAAFADLGKEIDELQGAAAASQEESQEAIQKAEQTADDAAERADQASDDVAKAEAEADEAKANADAAGACLKGYLSALGGAFDAGSLSEGVTKAKSDIQQLSGSCQGVLGSS